MRVQVISESVSINCIFLNVSKETARSCDATIMYGDNCEEKIITNGVRDSDSDSLVVISLWSFLEETMPSMICGFRVYATANTRIVTVDGNLLGKSKNPKWTMLKSVYHCSFCAHDLQLYQSAIKFPAIGVPLLL